MKRKDKTVTELLYFDHPLIFAFEAAVIETSPQEQGLTHVVLDKTYFYPTGGGQAHDIGLLDSQSVLDVRKENGTVVHIVQGNISKGTITAQVDKTRRIRNMQAHTGQHILSAAFIHALEAETVAVKMNYNGPSTVDVTLGELSNEQIEQVETLSNQVIMENRAVKSYFLAPDDPKLDELRRAVKFDKVAGDVRIVEIEDWDMSACAGTHFPFTGMLGLLKILKVENYKGGSRIHFAVGHEALDQFRHVHQVATDVSNLLSAGTGDVVDLVQKLQDERQSLSKQVAEQQTALMWFEKLELLNDAMTVGDVRLVKAVVENRTNDALKTLGNLLREESKTVAVIANQQGEDVGIIVSASDDSGIHAGNLLRSIVTDFNGRGGGSEAYAQGICKGLSDIAALMASVEQKIQTS
jgi:alanyl-tRNA synthetase